MGFYSNNISVSEFSNTIQYGNGLILGNLIPHWQYYAMRHNNETENLFVQQKTPGTYTKTGFEHRTSSEMVVESNVVYPKNSAYIVADFACSFNPLNSNLFIGLGEVILENNPLGVTISGLFLRYGFNGLFFEGYNVDTNLFSSPLSQWNGDADAIAYVFNYFKERIINFQIKLDKVSRQFMLFVVLDGKSYLLHAEKPNTDVPFYIPDFVLSRQYSFTAYMNNPGSFYLPYAQILVSPYTYHRETTLNYVLMPAPVTASSGIVTPIVVFGMRSVDRQCVDVLCFSGRQLVARQAMLGIVEYKTHIPGIVTAFVPFGSFGTNLNIALFQGAVPLSQTIPASQPDRYRKVIHMPNNNVDEVKSETVIKHACRISAALDAENITNQRTNGALFYYCTPAGGQCYGNVTIAEY